MSGPAKSGGGKTSTASNAKRRGTFGGSRLSLSSLLFSSAPKDREKLSRSANDLVAEEVSSGGQHRKGKRSDASGRAEEGAVTVTGAVGAHLAEEELEAADEEEEMECGLCYESRPAVHFPRLQTCPHRFCVECWRSYLETEINESRVRLSCAECPEPLHPTDVYRILHGTFSSDPQTLDCEPSMARCIQIAKGPDTPRARDIARKIV